MMTHNIRQKGSSLAVLFCQQEAIWSWSSFARLLQRARYCLYSSNFASAKNWLQQVSLLQRHRWDSFLDSKSVSSTSFCAELRVSFFFGLALTERNFRKLLNFAVALALGAGASSPLKTSTASKIIRGAKDDRHTKSIVNCWLLRIWMTWKKIVGGAACWKSFELVFAVLSVPDSRGRSFSKRRAKFIGMRLPTNSAETPTEAGANYRTTCHLLVEQITMWCRNQNSYPTQFQLNHLEHQATFFPEAALAKFETLKIHWPSTKANGGHEILSANGLSAQSGKRKHSK